MHQLEDFNYLSLNNNDPTLFQVFLIFKQMLSSDLKSLNFFKHLKKNFSQTLAKMEFLLNNTILIYH